MTDKTEKKIKKNKNGKRYINYLFKFHIFVFMYIFMAVFILYLTFRTDANFYGWRNILLSVQNTQTSAGAVKPVKPIVIIDAGHGGFDSGAVGVDNIEEKNLNLSIALKLKRLFNMSNFEVILTRETDILLNDDGATKKKASDLANRVKIANKYPDAIFVSIHMNKFPQAQTKGMQVFYSPNNLNSVNLAELIQQNDKEYLQPENHRGIKRGKDIFVLENIKNCGVLIECGFLSNPEEAHLLTQDDYQNKVAKIIFASIAEFEKTFDDNNKKID
ncbi:MAG: N-acetylmuramoyl-L-alanine amidase [Oscillospiraceae bacterium]|nr:N-acetylmuramoyl-L-alanine amidase [Oscillospiraceae bacterium]